MIGHIGFSYIGLLFLLLLFIPNLIWIRKLPQNYSSEHENKVLLFFERIGEILTSCCALLFSDFNLKPWTPWTWWLIAAFLLMMMYEFWWIKYFQSERKLSDFYSSLMGIPVAGATLPVFAFFPAGHIWQGHMDASLRSFPGHRAHRYPFAASAGNESC